MSRPAPVSRCASPAERERLARDFVALCEIESPSKHERAVAEFIVAELERLGLEVQEDDSRGETGSNTGNLIATVPGTGPPTAVLLAAHMDTVPLEAPVEVVRRDGRFTNRHDAILGADNKATVAALLGTARRLVEEPLPVDTELVFTTCEELAVSGARALDARRLHAACGFVFDRAAPIGEVVVAAPDYYRVEAEFFGTAAHAGARPEDGRSAIAAAAQALAEMELGRVSRDMTANAGKIEGGTAANVVPDHCRIQLEARSLDSASGNTMLEEIATSMRRAARDAGCQVRIVAEREFCAYELAPASPPVRVATDTLRALGWEPQLVAASGGSDASAFVAEGIPCVNMANGTERDHQPDESVTVAALESTLDLALEALARAALERGPCDVRSERAEGDDALV